MKFRIELANPGVDVSCIIQTRGWFFWSTLYCHDPLVENHVEYVPQVFEDFHDAYHYAMEHLPDHRYCPRNKF